MNGDSWTYQELHDGSFLILNGKGTHVCRVSQCGRSTVKDIIEAVNGWRAYQKGARSMTFEEMDQK